MPISDETSAFRLGEITQKVEACSEYNATPPWYLADARYIVRENNHFIPFFSGEEAFAEVAKSIKNAKKSIDIITMGFDPAMPLIRKHAGYTFNHETYEARFLRGTVQHTYSPWRKEDSYGEILLQTLRDHPELKIRIVLWYSHEGIGSSVIGIGGKVESELDKNELKTGFDPQAYGGRDGLKNLPLRNRHPEATRYSEEWFYNIRWKNFSEADTHIADRIAVVFRDIGNHSITEEDPRLGGESASLSWPADHQKMILVDYDNVAEAPQNCHAYVLGLNSQTEYWSAFPFVHRDIRNEMDNRPWHDFALRIQGSLVIDLNNNFCEAWGRDRKRILSTSDVRPCVSPSARRSRVPSIALEEENVAQLIQNRASLEQSILATPSAGSAAGQIVRTRPNRIAPNGSPEKEIKDAYLQATRHARNYILIVNQYCQYPKLIRHIKYWRTQAKNCGLSSKLYVLMGTCKPERGGMVFRAQQMANELGVGAQFPVADHEIYYQNEEDERRVSEGLAQALSSNPYRYEYANAEQHRRAGNRTTSGEVMKAVEERPSIAEMNALGIYPLFFMFYTQIPHATPEAIANAPREETLAQQVYVHAKLMVEDDAFFTLGSANLNIRSQAVDSELNIISDDQNTARHFREKLFRIYAGESGPNSDYPNYAGHTLSQSEIEPIYLYLKELVNENDEKIKRSERINGYISKFEDNCSVAATFNVRLG